MLGAQHPTLGATLMNYGGCLTEMKRYLEEKLLEAHGMLNAVLGEQHHQTRSSSERLVRLYEAWGKPAKAAEYEALKASRPVLSAPPRSRPRRARSPEAPASAPLTGTAP